MEKKLNHETFIKVVQHKKGIEMLSLSLGGLCYTFPIDEKALELIAQLYEDRQKPQQPQTIGEKIEANAQKYFELWKRMKQDHEDGTSEINPDLAMYDLQMQKFVAEESLVRLKQLQKEAEAEEWWQTLKSTSG